MRFILAVTNWWFKNVQNLSHKCIKISYSVKYEKRILIFWFFLDFCSAKKDEDLQDAMLQYYGAHLHCAARNRQAELDYLRTTAERVFPYILPLQSLKCKYVWNLEEGSFLKEILEQCKECPSNYGLCFQLGSLYGK